MMKKIESSKFEDLEKLAYCHMSAFPNSLSTRLGIDCCKKMQEFFVLNSRGVIFHAVDEPGNIVGYVSVLLHDKSGQAGSFTSIFHYALYSFIKGFIKKPWLLFSPEIKRNSRPIFNYFRKHIRKRRQVALSMNSDKKFIPYLGIVGIGVLKEYQGYGIGSAMLQQVINYCIEQKITRITLSVHSDNNRAIRAYKRNGFSLKGSQGNAMNMEKNVEL